ncbi:MAG: ATP-binding protein [Actinomycetota bacterium]
MITSRTGPLRRAGIVALQCLIVLASIAVTSTVAFGVQERSIRSATEERVLDVARSLAALPQVHDAIGERTEDATATLQPLADTVLSASGVDYVVITDSEGIRLTHPVPEARGLPVSTSPDAVLDGETFLGTETGTLGPTLRAKVPVVSGGVVVGAVSVGILESEIAASYQAGIVGMLPWVVGAALVGCVAAALVTGMLNRRMRVLAAEAREAQTQRRIAGALREQTHEFHTRLHIVRGLVALGESDDAVRYIDGVVPVTGGAPDVRLRALTAGLSTELRAHGAELISSGAPPESGVPDELLTAVANLCRNAAEAGAREVHVRWSDEQERVQMTVEDDGPGIPVRDRRRLFERGMTTKPDPEGAGRGIGLDLVLRSVQALGGTLEVGESRLGGARFTAVVPTTRTGG